MSRRKNKGVSTGFVALLCVAMFSLAAAILWVAVPMLANEEFGAPATYLTPTQKWSYSLQVVLGKSNLVNPVCLSSEPLSFVINSGDSVNQIVTNLHKAGLIIDAAALRSFLIYKGLDTQLLAGEYKLSCSKNALEIADLIKNPYLDAVIFNILPGWRAEEIAAALPTSGIEVKPDEFLRVVRDPSGLDLPEFLPSGSSVEGLLFPGEYHISRKVTAAELVQLFVNRFNEQVPDSLLNQAEQNGITSYQVVILASIVQRETFAAEERPLMASVFYNRLNAGMRLETDPTVQYALGYNAAWGWWKSPLSANDLEIRSDFNTYLVNGLPPAPIANPDLASIDAVIHPRESNYFYFRTKCDGSGMHSFATTFEEHVGNACN